MSFYQKPGAPAQQAPNQQWSFPPFHQQHYPPMLHQSHGGAQNLGQPPMQRQLYIPGPFPDMGRPSRLSYYTFDARQINIQCMQLDNLVKNTVALVEVSEQEFWEKEAFRQKVQSACREAIW